MRKDIFLLLVVLTGLCLGSLRIALSAELPKTVKERIKQTLFARYDQKNLNVMRDKILVTMLKGSGGDFLDYSINYDHFHPSYRKESWPDKYRRRNLLDEQTTEEVESGAELTDPLALGEMVRVRKFYVAANKAGDLWIDFYLAALDGKRVARMQYRYSDGGTGLQHKLDFGVHFRFLIPSVQAFKGSEAVEGGEKDYCDAISQVIGQYFLPTDEYHRAKRTEAETAHSKKSVNIQPGMTEEELLKAWENLKRESSLAARSFLNTKTSL
ncbi:MAG: hypothetical protein L0387_12225 [Acidobacteria bacterium]|nr:hypothetical protein [Acidobacteriota bacterium]MCI0725103.1 hypothetical protein [Acidobacteriota bacterium]